MKQTSRARYTVWNFLLIIALFCGVCWAIILFFYPSMIPHTLKKTGTEVKKGYYVKGAKIYNPKNEEVFFRGISRPSLEWSATGDNLSIDDYKQMKSWGFNLVRLPLNQQFWLKDVDGYQDRIAQNVGWIRSLDMDVILDLHWSDRGDTANDSAQQRMADDNSLTFWTEVAREYKHDYHVVFELYNEPHDVSWEVWQYGGDSGSGFEAVGMQDLYDAVRSTGAENLIIINGLDWAFELSKINEYPVQGYNLIYGIHIYDQPGKRLTTDWARSLKQVQDKHPVIITEFGNFDCDPSFYKSILSYAKTHHLGWVGWAWYPGGCGFPALISNWSGTPNVLGEELKKMLDTSL